MEEGAGCVLGAGVGLAGDEGTVFGVPVGGTIPGSTGDVLVGCLIQPLNRSVAAKMSVISFFVIAQSQSRLGVTTLLRKFYSIIYPHAIFCH